MTYEQLTVLISNERLQMSDRNREHFDIEARDHLKQLQAFPEDGPKIEQSIKHRIELHKSRNMYLVPPMLLPRDGESDSDHMKREYEAGGFAFIPWAVLNVKDGDNEFNIPIDESGRCIDGFMVIQETETQQELF